MPSLNVKQHTAIPRTNADTDGSSLSSDNTKSITTHLQAIAFTAGFHFAFIEVGGTSLYPTLAQKVTNLEVLRILLSIGPSETMHFQTWQYKAGNALPITDTDTGSPLRPARRFPSQTSPRPKEKRTPNPSRETLCGRI